MVLLAEKAGNLIGKPPSHLLQRLGLRRYSALAVSPKRSGHSLGGEPLNLYAKSNWTRLGTEVFLGRARGAPGVKTLSSESLSTAAVFA